MRKQRSQVFMEKRDFFCLRAGSGGAHDAPVTPVQGEALRAGASHAPRAYTGSACAPYACWPICTVPPESLEVRSCRHCVVRKG